MLAPARRIEVQLAVAFVGLVIIVGLLLGAIQYFQVRAVSLAAAERGFGTASHAVGATISELFRPAEHAVERIGRSPITEATDLAHRLDHLPGLARTLGSQPAAASIFVGYPDGDFLLLRPLNNDGVRKRFAAPEHSRYLVQSIERDLGKDHRAKGSRGVFLFLDQDLGEIERRNEPSYLSYDPRKRPWFKKAYESTTQIKTEPYIFFTTREVGTTLAIGRRHEAVVGLDITLSRLSDWLSAIEPAPNTDVALIDDSGRLIAHADSRRVAAPHPDDPERLVVATLEAPENAVLKALVETAGSRTGTVVTYSRAGRDYRGMVDPVAVQGTTTFRLIMAIADQDLFANANAATLHIAIIIAAIVLAGAMLALLFARRIARPLVQLAHDVTSIRRFDFSRREYRPSRIVEIDELAAAIDHMKSVIGNFLDISHAIAAEKHIDRLLQRLLDEIIDGTQTEAGILYLVSPDDSHFIPRISRLAGKQDLDHAVPSVPVSKGGSLLARTAEGKDAVEASADELDGLGIGDVGTSMKQDPLQLLTVPLLDRSRRLVGILLLLEVDEIDQTLINFAKALSASAALSIETQQLIATQRDLFESFIALIAGAIDTKSTYTGQHCSRVPALAEMLAEAAHRIGTGPFADFHLDEDDREALHLASLLHDCGKITTPEFVIDKATKLETIHNRLHEIRMRFEVMKQEAEIAYLRDILAEGESDERRQALAQELAGLDDDFAFLATCNIGNRPLTDEDIDRIRTVASRRWTRTLDDRIGLSHEERERKDRRPAPSLPVREPLLADKPEHRIERPASERIAPDNQWGFRVQVPERLYDRGEIYNLTIRRGTLTEEERYKINEHIIQTIKMLNALPFPKHLRSVPELAGGHHEKMDGTGYPLGLKGEEMSPVARMMAIADIFEALTAIDRPYMPPKPLSEALRIMAGMSRKQHIDRDLFRLFVAEGLPYVYAKRYMQPEQIDRVNVEEVLAAC